MQYLYHKEAGSPTLILSGDDHRYLFKVRRHRQGETIALRNLEDQQLYHYRITTLDKKEAHLHLETVEAVAIQAQKSLHIGWCLIDPKNIEKVLPTLNEMGVAKITFIECARSQKDFRLDFKRLEKILLNSSQQCGRSVMMGLATVKSLDVFLQENPNSYMLNFSEQILGTQNTIETIIIGCEGGFTDKETALFAKELIIGLNTQLILKSESAVCAVAAKILL